LGATEQHGPHLPLATDTIIAEAWAVGVAERIEGAVAAPALPYGSSGEHQSFAGTLSIGGPALHHVAVELARSASPGFTRLDFLSGHAGNDGTLREVVDQLRHEGHDAIHLVPTWSTERFGPIDAHAGRVETSLLLHLRPDLVRLDEAEPGAVEPLSELLADLVRGGVGAVSANGVLGDPSGSTAEEGRRLLDDLIDRTVERLDRPEPPASG
ncbi:MAG: mycofactocin biosynthesis peptidyl-dipeptidase MftE, partial [Actinomycetota bacterium]